MRYKLILITCVFTLASLSYGQQGRVAKLRAEVKNKQLNDEVFNDDDADFLVTEAPEKWKDESAVVLCQKYYYSFVEKGGSKFVNKETSRRRIMILDDAALEYYSIYYYKHNIYEDNKIGIKIIKPDGKEQEVDLSSSVEVGINEIPGSYRTFYSWGNKYKKLAIPNLEKGDILDYYQIYSDESKPSASYAFNRFTFTLAGRYPILKQKFFFNVDQKFNISFRSYNGAPELVEGDAGVNRNGKVKEDIRTFSFEDDNREKYKDEHWKLEYIEDATVKFQVFYIPPSLTNKVKHFISEDGLLNKELDYEDIRMRLFNDEAQISNMYGQDKFDNDTYSYVNRYHKDKSDLEKIEVAYYYLRYLYNKNVLLAFANSYYSSQYNIDVKKEIFVDDVRFANTMASILKKMKIDYRYVIAVKNQYGSFKNVLFPQELVAGIKAEGKYIFAFSQYSTFDYIPSNIRGSEAILYKSMPSRYEKVPITEETIPNSQFSKNEVLTEQNITLNEDLTILNVKETTTRSGYQKSDHQSYLIADDKASYLTKDHIRYDPRYRPIEEKPLRGNKVRIAEIKRQKEAEEKEKKKKRYESLKKYHDGKNYELDEYLDFELISDGRFSDSTKLVVKEEYTLKSFINKAGRNYTFNIGNLIGGQFQLDKEDLERIADVNINFPKAYKYKIKIKLPDGYVVSGLDQINSELDNNIGMFKVTAKVEGGYINLTSEKVYKIQKSKKEDWSGYIEFLDAAFNFSQKKVILKKQ